MTPFKDVSRMSVGPPLSTPQAHLWRRLRPVLIALGTIVGVLAGLAQIFGVSIRDVRSGTSVLHDSVESEQDFCNFLRRLPDPGNQIGLDVWLGPFDRNEGLSFDETEPFADSARDESQTTRQLSIVADQIVCENSPVKWSYVAIFSVPPNQSGGGITYTTLATRRLSGTWRVTNYERPGVGLNILRLRFVE
jgi:hypothetical protein